MELVAVAAASRRAGVRLALGALLALAGAAGVGVKLQAVSRTERVLAARHPVELGQVIRREDLTVKEISAADGLPAVAASRLDRVVGRVARDPIRPGQLLHPEAVAGAPPLKAGEVAMTLALREEQAVGGLVRSGDRVAVLGTSAGGVGSGVVLPEVTVLSVRARRGAGGDQEVLVTLRLVQAEAARLQAAYRGEKIDLALVGR